MIPPGPERGSVREQFAHDAAGLLLRAVYALATLQVVWFYLARVRCYVDLQAFEQGKAPNPFQQRVLLMYPLRWAHSSGWLQTTAATLANMGGWFPHGVRAEGLLQAGVDTLAVVAGGLVAQALYRRSSPTGLLSAYVYPLTLVMCASTYSHLAYHAYRFLPDLPSMAFFSVGMLLLYLRSAWMLFAAVFVVGTTNRETMLLLLVVALIDEAHVGGRVEWKRLLSPRSGMIVAPLLAWWALWHVWIVHQFRGNATVAAPRLGLNLGVLVVPWSWPQLLAAFAFVLPGVSLLRSRIPDQRLRSWLWILPCWLGFMLYFGLLVEIRIFGELIPYMACLAALVAEQTILEHAQQASAGAVV